MRTYFFDLIVEHDLTDEADADSIFETFGGDVTPAVSNGTPLLMCSVEAETVEGAVRPTVARLRAMGVEVRAVQFEPDDVLV